MKMATSYKDSQLDIDVYDDFLANDRASEILDVILSEAPFKKRMLTKKGEPMKRRNKLIFADDDFPEYTIVYRGKVIKTPTLRWSTLPILKELRDRVSEKTGQPYNTCVIQVYSNGSVGIKPHRDKEVDFGTNIVSISLGETRTMRFERSGKPSLDIPLVSGSLCVLRPPTNNYWLHSIPLDETQNVRASIIFRNFHTKH